MSFDKNMSKYRLAFLKLNSRKEKKYEIKSRTIFIRQKLILIYNVFFSFCFFIFCRKNQIVFGDNHTLVCLISLTFRQFCIMVRYHSPTDNINVTILYIPCLGWSHVCLKLKRKNILMFVRSLENQFQFRFFSMLKFSYKSYSKV